MQRVVFGCLAALERLASPSPSVSLGAFAAVASAARANLIWVSCRGAAGTPRSPDRRLAIKVAAERLSGTYRLTSHSSRTTIATRLLSA
jgi:hypothetical protein